MFTNAHPREEVPYDDARKADEILADERYKGRIAIVKPISKERFIAECTKLFD